MLIQRGMYLRLRLCVLTYIVQVKCQVLVLKQGIIGEAGTLNLLEEGADIPPVQDIQQHDAGDAQAHVEHGLDAVLHRHVLGFNLCSAGGTDPYDGTLTEGALQGRRHRRHGGN